MVLSEGIFSVALCGEILLILKIFLFDMSCPILRKFFKMLYCPLELYVVDWTVKLVESSPMDIIEQNVSLMNDQVWKLDR